MKSGKPALSHVKERLATDGGSGARIHILTVAEILDGKTPYVPKFLPATSKPIGAQRTRESSGVLSVATCRERGGLRR